VSSSCLHTPPYSHNINTIPIQAILIIPILTLPTVSTDPYYTYYPYPHYPYPLIIPVIPIQPLPIISVSTWKLISLSTLPKSPNYPYLPISKTYPYPNKYQLSIIFLLPTLPRPNVFPIIPIFPSVNSKIYDWIQIPTIINNILSIQVPHPTSLLQSIPFLPPIYPDPPDNPP